MESEGARAWAVAQATAGVIGDEYFSTLVRALVQEHQFSAACVAKLQGGSLSIIAKTEVLPKLPELTTGRQLTDARIIVAQDRMSFLLPIRESSGAIVGALGAIVSEPLRDAERLQRALETITQRAAAELVRADKQREEVNAARREAQGRIAGQISHKINNVLGPLIAYPDLLEQEITSTPFVRELLRDLRASGQRVAEMNQRLYGLDGPRRISDTTIDLREIVEAAANLSRSPGGISWVNNISHEPLWVRGDSSQLTRLFLALFTNAIESLAVAAHAGATIRVTSQRVVEPRAERRKLRGVASWAQVTVEDDGIGVGDDGERIFEPFYSTKNALGLGLPVADRIAGVHGGTIELETAERGARFAVYLPIDADGSDRRNT